MSTDKPICKVTEEIKAYFDSRTELGLKKYNVTMDRNDLSLEEWVTHAIDELADGIQYLWKVRQDTLQAKKEAIYELQQFIRSSTSTSRTTEQLIQDFYTTHLCSSDPTTNSTRD